MRLLAQRLLQLASLIAAAAAALSLASHLFSRYGPVRLLSVAQLMDSKVRSSKSEGSGSAASWADRGTAGVRLIHKDVQLPTVCSNLTCKEAYVRHLLEAGRREHPIPPVRHLLWKSENVSAYFAKQLRTWRQVHPDWTVVLWRDQDLKPFVRKHFPAAVRRFLELDSSPIMQVDMIRYMLLFKYGGVYADLDYSLVASLDEYRRFYAVITREPEVHSLQNFGFQWPPRPFASPAFMMSAPGHSFFRYSLESLQKKPFVKNQPPTFAGPYALSYLLEDYLRDFPVANSAMETVYLPPSYSFHPYEDNRLNTSGSAYTQQRVDSMRNACRGVRPNWAEQLKKYCKDPNNMDPITDRTQPVVAVHDLKKSGAVYDGVGTKFYFENAEPIRKAVGAQLQLGRDWL
uniref:Glycosyltransferase family 32 protein n=1 Tax=Macrostomum lignano TaxID=282301 RepID=A0A1I8H821_9PLAT